MIVIVIIIISGSMMGCCCLLDLGGEKKKRLKNCSFFFSFLLLFTEKMEKTFYDAAKNGKVEEVKDILRKNPALNVNWKNFAYSALHAACYSGHDSVVSILLAHPDINPNLKQEEGYTPFMIACYHGETSCVRLLLQDQRVMVNEPDNYGNSPLKWAAYFGYHDVIKWWIASGREMNLGKPGDDKTDPIRAAKQYSNTEVVTLLERFKSDATKTRSEIRLELGINGTSIHPSSSSLSVVSSFHSSFGI